MSQRLIPLKVEDGCLTGNLGTGFHCLAKFRPGPDPVLACEHRLAWLRRKLDATLTTTCSQDGAPGASLHA